MCKTILQIYLQIYPRSFSGWYNSFSPPPRQGTEPISFPPPTGTHTIHLLQILLPHLRTGEELLFQFADLEQGGHGAWAYPAHSCSSLAVRVSSQSWSSLVASNDLSGNLPASHVRSKAKLHQQLQWMCAPQSWPLSLHEQRMESARLSVMLHYQASNATHDWYRPCSELSAFRDTHKDTEETLGHGT